MLFNLLAAPVTGLTWIAEQVHDRVMEEFDQKSVLSQQLLALQMAFDLGQIDEDVFDEKEEVLLLALQEIDDAEQELN